MASKWQLIVINCHYRHWRPFNWIGKIENTIEIATSKDGKVLWLEVAQGPHPSIFTWIACRCSRILDNALSLSGVRLSRFNGFSVLPKPAKQQESDFVGMEVIQKPLRQWERNWRFWRSSKRVRASRNVEQRYFKMLVKFKRRLPKATWPEQIYTTFRDLENDNKNDMN